MLEKPSPPLAAAGFGTAHLMGRIGPREAARLIHAAVDSGILHFDTARVYGLGDSEYVLGRALRRRPDISIFSKVGQGRAQHSRLRAHLHGAGRPLARARARLLSTTENEPHPTRAFVRRTNFSTDYVRESIETSLRLLGREPLDGLLLHEITQKDVTPELIELLDGFIRQGKIRRYGTASDANALKDFQPAEPPGQIIQQSGGPFAESVYATDKDCTVMHSIFGQKGKHLSSFQSWLSRNAESEKLLWDAVAAENLHDIPALLISYTSTAQVCSHLLFSSTSEERIRRNVESCAHRTSTASLSAVSAALNAYKAHREATSAC